MTVITGLDQNDKKRARRDRAQRVALASDAQAVARKPLPSSITLTEADALLLALVARLHRMTPEAWLSRAITDEAQRLDMPRLFSAAVAQHDEGDV